MTEVRNRAVRLFWAEIPAKAARVWRGLAAVLTDGRYLTAWPWAAAALPPIAFAAGFATGGFRPRSDEIFTMSIAWPVVLLAFGALGAGIGIYAWLGFVIGDLFVFPHISWETSLPQHLLKETLPLLIVYEVLLGIAVLLPLAAASLPGSLTGPLERVLRPTPARFAVRLLLAATVAGLTALSWSASVQVLIRPVATFHGGILGPAALQPLRDRGLLFIAVAVIVTSVRVVAEPLAQRRGTLQALELTASDAGDEPNLLRRLASTVVVSFLMALGLTGLLDSPYDLTQDLILFGAVVGSAVLRTIIVPSVPGYARLVNRIPVIVRIVAIGIAGGAVAQIVLGATSLQGYLQLSFLPILISVAIGMGVTALVIPTPRQAREEPS